MANQDLSVPKERETEAQTFGLKSIIARSLELTQQDVDLKNPSQFLDGDSRFLYGFTESTGKVAGFLKMARTQETNKQLKRESVGMAIARRIGIPTIGILDPYQDILEGYGLIHVEQLDLDHGLILISPELIAGADPVYGARAARAIANAGGRVIPPDIDSIILKRGDWRNESPETFWKVWDEQNNSVFDLVNANVVTDLLGRDGKERLQKIIEETRTAIEPLIDESGNPNVEYFVHNDTAPNNIFFSDDGETVILLDFEHAGATHNLMLAQLTDLGNFYGRMWPNPEMQQQFLSAYLTKSTPEALEYNYQLLRATAVFGAMFLAKYGMKLEHSEHIMSESLLSNLEGNLAFLENTYNELKAMNTITVKRE